MLDHLDVRDKTVRKAIANGRTVPAFFRSWTMACTSAPAPHFASHLGWAETFPTSR